MEAHVSGTDAAAGAAMASPPPGRIGRRRNCRQDQNRAQAQQAEVPTALAAPTLARGAPVRPQCHAPARLDRKREQPDGEGHAARALLHALSQNGHGYRFEDP